MSACEFAAQGVRMEIEKVAGAPVRGHGRGRGCSGGKKHHPICCTGFANLNARGGKGTGQLEKYAELAKCDFFFRRSWPNCGLGSPSWTS